MKWYKRDPHRYLEGTRELSFEERGFYNCLIELYMARDGHLPDDDLVLARLTGGYWRTIRALKLALFQKRKIVSDGVLIVPNGSQECLREAAGFIEKQRRIAKKRWKNNETADATAMPIQPQPQPQKKRVTLVSPKEGDTSVDRMQSEADFQAKQKSEADFREWYLGYPHKVGKAAAKKAYEKARQKVSQQDLIAGCQRYIRSKPADRQWCNPATWLNGERWLDQPAAVASKPSYYKPGLEGIV